MVTHSLSFKKTKGKTFNFFFVKKKISYRISLQVLPYTKKKLFGTHPVLAPFYWRSSLYIWSWIGEFHRSQTAASSNIFSELNLKKRNTTTKKKPMKVHQTCVCRTSPHVVTRVKFTWTSSSPIPECISFGK